VLYGDFQYSSTGGGTHGAAVLFCVAVNFVPASDQVGVVAGTVKAGGASFRYGAPLLIPPILYSFPLTSPMKTCGRPVSRVALTFRTSS
jgi:hypothetical protein